MIFEGDSLSNPNFIDPFKWTEQLALLPNYAPFCHPQFTAVSGSLSGSPGALDRITNYPTLRNGEQGIYFLLIGINDVLSNVASSPILANITTLIAAAKALDYRCVVLEMPSNGNTNGGTEPVRVAVNAGLTGVGADAIVPTATLLPDWTNLTYFNPDRTHLTTAGGAVIADWINANINPQTL